jgi:hypothetical protein
LYSPSQSSPEEISIAGTALLAEEPPPFDPKLDDGHPAERLDFA